MQNETTRQALGVMTAWATGEDTRLAGEQMQEVVKEQGVEGLASLAVGLINLSALLLILRERDQGVAPVETLRSIAAGPINNGPPVV